jgi:2,5-diketo-D-gluconate reductase B
MAGEIFKVPEISEVAQNHDTNEATIAFAWLMQKDTVVPVTESTSRDHLTANLKASEVSLEDHEIELIDGIERESKVWGPDGLLIDKPKDAH